MESDYVVQKVLEALQEQSAQMVMSKCGECPIIALHQQVIETLREVTNAEIAVKFNMVPKIGTKCPRASCTQSNGRVSNPEKGRRN